MRFATSTAVSTNYNLIVQDWVHRGKKLIVKLFLNIKKEQRGCIVQQGIGILFLL